MRCANCPIRKKAEKNPHSLLYRIWKWHTTWCPGYRSYQAKLSRKQPS
ncbi:hypothetical protein [Thermosyntropha lipolytica]|nr:hypothetical protein [Thermosyntropha lipolytica]